MASADEACREDDATSPRRVRPWQDVIVVEPACYVEITDAQRRAAVAAFTSILANWWQQHGGDENATASRSVASPVTQASPSAEDQ